MRKKERQNHVMALTTKEITKDDFSNNLKCKLALSSKQEQIVNAEEQHSVLENKQIKKNRCWWQSQKKQSD